MRIKECSNNFVGNKAKRSMSKRCYKETKYTKFSKQIFLNPDMYTCRRKFGEVCFFVKQVLTLALLLCYQRFYKLNSNSRAAIYVTYKPIIKSKNAVPNKQALIPSTSKPQFFLEGKNHFLKL